MVANLSQSRWFIYSDKRSLPEKIGYIFAVILISVIFYIDAFTDIEGAIAGLYVVALLILAPALTSRGTVLSALICAGLTLAAYFPAHGAAIAVPPGLRVVVSLAALWITCALLLRNKTSHDELLATNQALSDSEARYRSIFEQSRVALWERDYSSVHEYLSQLRSEGVRDLRSFVTTRSSEVTRAIAGIKTLDANNAARDVLGLAGEAPLPDFLAQQLLVDADTTLKMLDVIYNEQEVFEGKCIIKGADGVDRDVLLSVRFPKDPAAFKRVAVAMLDITQREKAQRAYNEAQAKLSDAARAATAGTLSASLAHELNQPLGAVVLNTQTLLRWLDRDPPDLGAVRRSADRIIRDGQRASEIILNARRQLKQEKRTFEEFCLRELVEETKALMEHDLSRERIELLIDAPLIPPRIHMVRIEVQQVLINLVSNAVQAIAGSQSSERLVHVSLGPNGTDRVQLSVRDTGPGIPKHALDQVFTPFFTTKSTGMGMGLSICQSTLEAMGGELTAANSELGGALFNMDMPVRAVE